jgi:2-polyprenyl-3-methyl-5-hydroxy-6-metoxy-1,4-benzoquinol methylase
MKCLVCSSSKTEFQFISKNRHGRNYINNEEFKVFRCSNCQAYFISDLKESDEYFKKYYLEDYYKKESQSILDKILDYLQLYSFKQKEQFIKKNFDCLSSKISILDLGCGDGKFLENLDSKIFEKEGIDVNQKSIDICEKKGIKTFKGTISNFPAKKHSFDVITLWHVAEHLFNPLETIGFACKFLKKGGLLIISVPNTNSIGFKTARENWFHFDSPRHTYLPNNKTIQYLAKKNKLKIENEINEFYDFPLDLFWSLAFSKYKILLFLFPILKILSSETRTYIIKK